MFMSGGSNLILVNVHAKKDYSSHTHLLSICCVLSILVPVNTYPCGYANKYRQWPTVLAIKEVHTRCNEITEKLALNFAQSNQKRCHWTFWLSAFFLWHLNSLDGPELICVPSPPKPSPHIYPTPPFLHPTPGPVSSVWGIGVNFFSCPFFSRPQQPSSSVTRY